MAPEIRFLKGFFFLIFLGINTHNFTKNESKFENKSLIDAIFYGVYMKKISDSKGLIFGIWGIKTRLGQFGLKAFLPLRIYQVISQEP